MKLYIVAGEASGDLHAAALASALRRQDPDVQLRGMGGPRMADAGVEIAKSIDDMQIMGFLEVLQNISHLRRVFERLEQDFRQFQPDALILVDYPGFNLRFARAVRDAGAKIIYYISPQVWAWHRSRLEQMQHLVDRMLVVFDFERPFYEQAGVPVDFVGHPLVERLDAAPPRDQARAALQVTGDALMIALLPGSRGQEVARILPVMRRAAALLPEQVGGREVRFAIAAPPHGDALGLSGEYEGLPVYTGRMHEVVRAADFAWVSSGTATLETALLGTPFVCCYAGAGLSYALASMIVDMPCISLANIVAGRPIVPELVQKRLQADHLASLTVELLNDPDGLAEMRRAFEEVRVRVGAGGASERAAQAVRDVLKAASSGRAADG